MAENWFVSLNPRLVPNRPMASALPNMKNLEYMLVSSSLLLFLYSNAVSPLDDMTVRSLRTPFLFRPGTYPMRSSIHVIPDRFGVQSIGRDWARGSSKRAALECRSVSGVCGA